MTLKQKAINVQILLILFLLFLFFLIHIVGCVKFALGIEFAYDFVAFSKWISEMA